MTRFGYVMTTYFCVLGIGIASFVPLPLRLVWNASASRDDAERLALIVPGRDQPVAPTHWSFGQLASLVGAPAGYLRQLPAPLAGINLQHGLIEHRAELMKTLETEDGRVELRAVTGPDYGRIWDHELVAAVMKIAGNGTGDTRWKVPGLPLAKCPGRLLPQEKRP